MTELVQQNKSSTQTITTMKAFAIVVFAVLFFTSTLVHANHSVEQSTHVEQQECHTCHQGIDTPPELPQLQQCTVASYFFTFSKTTTTAFKGNSFVQPQLRAPPSFQ